MGAPDGLLERLQQAGRLDLEDFLFFEIEADPHRPDIEAEGMKYDGFRFRAEAKLAGKLYGQRFGVDVAFGDPILDVPEIIVADDVFGFAGISPPTIRIYPIETHIAEKLHAYTLPRTRPNSRVRDLPDLALLGTIRSLDAARVRRAIEQTFAFRATHDRPSRCRRLRLSGASPTLRWPQTIRFPGQHSTVCSRPPGLFSSPFSPMHLVRRNGYGFRNFQNYRLRVRALCG